MNQQQENNLETGLKKLGLDTSGREYELLLKYIAEIELWNPRYGLIAPDEDLIRRHILDSLSGLSAIQDFAPDSLADVGSGAGLPGIPLSIYMPDTQVSLIERMGRRAGFLRTLSVGLGLRNVQVLEKPVEEISSEEAGFKIVTFRAWSAIDAKVLDSVASILAADGLIAAYKGRRDVVDAELESVSERIRDLRILPLYSGGMEGERHLVLFGLKN